MKTLRPLGVTLTPKPGQPLSQSPISLAEVGRASIALLVSFNLGIASSHQLLVVLPRSHIGSSKQESACTTVPANGGQSKHVQAVINFSLRTPSRGTSFPRTAGERRSQRRFPLVQESFS